MLIPAFVLFRDLFKCLLLFLSANSSSDGFRSGLRFGSSFFMVLGLLLRSCAGKIKIRRVELLYNISKMQLLRCIHELLTKNLLTAPKFSLLFFSISDLPELANFLYTLPPTIHKVRYFICSINRNIQEKLLQKHAGCLGARAKGRGRHTLTRVFLLNFWRHNPFHLSTLQ